MQTMIELSSWRLSLADGLLRLPVRNQAMRPANFEDRYDAQTVFYDVFWGCDNQSVIIVAPPLLNLERDLECTVKALPSGVPCKPKLSRSPHVNLIFVSPPPGTVAFMIETAVGVVVRPIQPNLSALFQGQRIIYTLQKDNDLQWIRDWAHFYAREHGATAAVIYDNGSSRYDRQEVGHVLSSVDAIEQCAVVDWSFPYGAFDLREEISFDLLDSIYCQVSAFAHVAARLAARAGGLLNADLDELVVGLEGGSLFEALERSPNGYLQFHGYWVENVRNAGMHGRERRHRDYVCREAPEPAVCEPKWVVAPARLPKGAALHIHGVFNAAPEPVCPFRLYHFKAINTLWDKDRPMLGHRGAEANPRPDAHQRDDLLAGALARAFGDDDNGWSAARTPIDAQTRGLVARIRSGRAAAAGRSAEAIAAAKEAIAWDGGIQSYHEHLSNLLPDPAEAQSSRSRAQALRERDFGFHFQTGRRLMRFGRHAEAVPHLDRSIALQAGHAPSIALLLNCLAAIGDFDRVAASMEAFVEAAPCFSTLKALLPYFRARGNWDEAAERVARARARTPDDDGLLYISAVVNLSLGAHGQARADVAALRARHSPADHCEALAEVDLDSCFLWTVGELDPARGTLEELEARILACEGWRVEAADLMATAARRNYQSIDHYLKAADLYDWAAMSNRAIRERGMASSLWLRTEITRPPRERGERAAKAWKRRHAKALRQILSYGVELDVARALLREVRGDPPLQCQGWLGVARAAFERGDLDTAEESARSAAAIGDESGQAETELARVLLAQGAYQAAENAAMAAMTKTERLGPRFLFGAIIRASGRTGEAIRVFGEIVERNPGWRKAHRELFSALLSEGRVIEAVAAARTAILHCPDGPEHRIDLARGLLHADGPEASLLAIEEALQQWPDHAALVARRAELLVRLKRFPEAIEAAERMASIDPESLQANRVLAQALAGLGRFAEALAALSRCADLKTTTDIFVRNLLADIQSRQGGQAIEGFRGGRSVNGSHWED